MRIRAGFLFVLALVSFTSGCCGFAWRCGEDRHEWWRWHHRHYDR
jgi:hypothetical protein